jgi:hypothetical protein
VNPVACFWPSDERAEKLFSRLTANDPLATSELAEAYLEPLIAFLSARHPYVDDHMRQTAVEEALISLFKNPTQFKRNLGGLTAYLKMSADGDLKNLLAKDEKHYRNRENHDPVELEAAHRNRDDRLADSELPSFDHPTLAAVIGGLSDGERATLELMRKGERKTSAFAAALGLADLSPDKQAVEVKRVKDRIKQRFKRTVEDES